jgi:hypothetical protein
MMIRFSCKCKLFRCFYTGVQQTAVVVGGGGLAQSALDCVQNLLTAEENLFSRLR